MRDYVIINGVSSLTINGLAISKLPPISKSLMRNMKEEIDGRDGDIITELGYSAYDKEMEIGLYGNFDINEIISFFNGEGTITFSNESDKHYYFKILDQIDYEKLLKFKTATITFHCQPFKYPNSETVIDVDSLTLTDTGTDITLSNTSLYEPIKIDLLGDSSQSSTPTPTTPVAVETVTGEQNIKVCGKNLFNVYNSSSVISVNVTFNRNDDGTITLNGTSNGNGYVEILYAFQNGTVQQNNPFLSLDNNEQYKISFFHFLGTTTATDIRFVYQYDSTGNQTTIYPNNSQTISNSNGLYRAYIRIPSGATFTNYTIGIQLEKGNQSTSFEEYKEISYPINLGKNLFDKDNYNLINSYYVDASGTITFGAYNRMCYLKLQPNTTYTLSQSIVSNVTRRIALYNAEPQIGSTGTVIGTFTGTNPIVQTFTTTTTGIYLGWVYCNTNNVGDYTEQDMLDCIQVERGSQATTYASYFTPIELLKIDSYQDFIRKGTGKNLLDFATKNIGATISMGIGSTGTLNSSTTGICTWIEMEDGASYTFSGDLSSVNSNVVRCLVTNDEVQIGTTCLRVDNFQTGNYTYTNANNYKYFVMVFTGATVVGSDWQLEEGNAQTLYEPFGFEGKWYLYKRIGKYVANDDLTGNGQTETRIDLLTPVLDIQASLSSANLGQMSMTNVLTTTPTGTVNQGLSGTTNVSKIRVQLSKEYANNNTEANSFLKNKNFTIYYVSNNPTATEITNEALLTQLNALSNAYAYDGTTNIISSGYLPSILSVSATAIPNTTITNIGNIYAKPLLTIYGSGDISLYLNGIQVLQIALGDSGEITIDISNMEAYNKDTKVLMNRLVTGDYSNFLINSGTNKLLITGDVSNFTMSNYTRWL